MIGGFQPPQDGVRNGGAGFRVAVEVAVALIVHGEVGDFAGIVEQTGPAQNRVRRQGGGHMGCVGEQIVGVVAAVLVKADHGLQLRNHGRQNGTEAAQILGGDQGEKFT